jgi:hypothetical protein
MFEHEVKHALDVRAVDADHDTHYHVLGTFGDAAINAEEVRSLEGFESEAGIKVR